LRCFSLICRHRLVFGYDDRVVPLLRRMSQLEKLTLYLRIRNRDTYIDGSHLNNDILIHMAQRHSFTFYISTDNSIGNNMDVFLPYVSNDDVQRTFTDIGYHQTTCVVNYFPNARAVCHIFSLPFEFDHLERIANRFPTIVFNHVTLLMVLDMVPFEHEFFFRIARAFPVLRLFSVMNLVPQISNVDERQSNNNQPYSIVEYLHLISLDITYVITDYIEQFLLETKTHLPRLIELKVTYDQLKLVTKNFTRAATRSNCTKVERLITERTSAHPREVQLYFPSFVN
jgi:hypothetical protein